MANFSYVLDVVKNGGKAQRKSWNAPNQYIILLRPSDPMSIAGGEMLPMMNCVGLKTAQCTMQPGWVPSQGDLLAEDWIIIQ